MAAFDDAPLVAHMQSSPPPQIRRDEEEDDDLLYGTSNSDLLANTPVAITRVLSLSSPFVHAFHGFLSLITWQKGSKSKAFLLLFAWWALSLFGREILMYGFNWVFVAIIGFRWLKKGRRERLGQAAPLRSTTHADLHRTVTEVDDIADQLSQFNTVVTSIRATWDWTDVARTRTVLRYFVYSYPSMLILTYFVGLRWLFFVGGTLALIWCSPWFTIIRLALWRSRIFRGLLKFFLWAFVAGQVVFTSKTTGKPKSPFSVRGLIRRAREQQKTAVKAEDNEDPEAKKNADLIFQFVVYENQRWWLGLDWNTNLFPQERPAWSDEYNESVPSTDMFTLPPPSTTLTIHPSETSKYIRRTMSWCWADDTWRIDRESRPVDSDGWEYGNNRWEKLTPASSMGKYTRRRRWIRAARLVEEVEKVDKIVAERELELAKLRKGRSRTGSVSSRSSDVMSVSALMDDESSSTAVTADRLAPRRGWSNGSAL